MAGWLGPALIAAVVSGLVSVLGWFATFYIGLRRDQMLRDEKVRDFQVALRAEILSDLLTMAVADRGQFLREITGRYREDADYSVVVPHMASNPIFEAIVSQIHILPAEVIEPVVHYERLRETVERFVADMRSSSFLTLSRDRQLVMYGDYLNMLGRLETLARDALRSLSTSLSIPDGDPSSQVSASALGSALEGASDEP